MSAKSKLNKKSLIFHSTYGLGIVISNSENKTRIIEFREKSKQICVKESELTVIPYYETSILYYENALYEAYENGVKILPICVSWIDNNCYFLKNIDLLPKLST